MDFLRPVQLLLLCLPVFLVAQNDQCSGNLGENIFVTGDFGGGVPNIVPNDPGIAPGYTYTTSPPPYDGYYLLTRDMADWPDIYGDWHAAADNSPDPLGYMMVVNADFSPGIFYTQTVDGLCENTLYEFSADVINLDRKELTGRIYPNVSFYIDGEEQFGTGDVPNDENWHTYGFTFTTGPGVYSVELSLVNNAPGGLGNDLAIDNIAFRPCGPEISVTPAEETFLCLDGGPMTLTATLNGGTTTPSLQWQISYDQGANWVEVPNAHAPTLEHAPGDVGTYYYRLLVAGDPAGLQNPKCRVISPLRIVEVPPREYTVTDTICEGLSYVLGERTLQSSGSYSQTFVSSRGCDSTVILNLTVVPDPGITAEIGTAPASCHDSSDGNIRIANIQGGAAPYAQMLTNAEGISLSSTEGLAAGPYHLQLTDRFGCAFERDILVDAPPPFTVELGMDQAPWLGETVTLRPDANAPVANYLWRPAGLIDCSQACQAVTFLPTASDWVQLLATSEVGCTAVDSLRIEVLAEPRLYLPNIFSPNDDGRNDRFYVSGFAPGVEAMESFQVFDRWGSLVFERKGIVPNDALSGWDGRIAGQPAPVGTYVYRAQVRTIDGVLHTVAGSVVLIR